MSRPLAVVAAVIALVVAVDAWAVEVHGVPLPRGSRSVEPNLFESGRGFRKTVDFYKRWLKRQGLSHEEVPVYRYRGVVIARFVSKHATTEWKAIHVFRRAGRTRIFVVLRGEP